MMGRLALALFLKRITCIIIDLNDHATSSDEIMDQAMPTIPWNLSFSGYVENNIVRCCHMPSQNVFHR
jgi:hypothetical protein